ncbi:MAG: TRAP transporter small permease subunit [Phyllobacteriaceae bacterium]|nr:TRAP transporter small permease subunit [Phyllobacteriaceae bacterium]
MSNRFVSIANQGVAHVVRWARWLVLPVVLLLFLQWPLRDGVGRWSREANDLGQWLFALYVAVAVTAATRAGRHLSADLFAHRFAGATRRRIAVAGVVLGLFPWAGYVLWVAWRPAWRSILGLERFQDTDDPGYFLIKAALLVGVSLILVQGAVDLLRWRRRR